jgi:hypothetical protein
MGRVSTAAIVLLAILAILPPVLEASNLDPVTVLQAE